MLPSVQRKHTPVLLYDKIIILFRAVNIVFYVFKTALAPLLLYDKNNSSVP
jgi:hypothetical protein